MKPKFLDNNFLEQAKWILAPNNVKYAMNCPLVSSCQYCVVYNKEDNYKDYHFVCPSKSKIETAKKYLNFIRSEKLKRISK